MRFLCKRKDGGVDSKVTGYWLLEVKTLFSIVLLRFNEGSREVFHSHAFNALTWFLTGEVEETHLSGEILTWKPSWLPKFTSRNCFHKVYGKRTTWALSLRGPWKNTWKEFSNTTSQYTVLTHGRKKVDDESKI